jgi:hypothetical protein
MIHDSSEPLVSRNVDAAIVAAESKSFADFDRWMDTQLDLLVAQWIHTAAPNASRPDWRNRRISSQAK